MRQWGLAVVSIGGVMIISSQLQENAFPFIVAGISLIVVGIVMFKKAKKDEK